MKINCSEVTCEGFEDSSTFTKADFDAHQDLCGGVLSIFNDDQQKIVLKMDGEVFQATLEVPLSGFGITVEDALKNFKRAIS